jgi:hypothetical protein
MSKRTNALLTIGIGAILVVAIIAVVAFNLDKFLAVVGIQYEPEPREGGYGILPVEEEGWHEEARCVERIIGADVLIMREDGNTASAALCLPDEMDTDESLNVVQFIIATLNVMASDEAEYLVVSCVTAPEGEDPRYPLTVGVVCEVEEGHVGSCESYSLLGGYLSPDSVWWPGIGE